MSTEEVRQKAKDALKSVREVIEKTEAAAHEALDRAAPALQKSIDASMDAAAKGFTATMKSVEGATTVDQVKILKAYRKFLAGQAGYVEARIKDLEGSQKRPEGSGS